MRRGGDDPNPQDFGNEPADAWVRLFMVQAAFCHEWLGEKEEARQLFERVVQETKPTPDTIVKPEANGLPSTLALAYAGLGEKEKALQQASQAVKDYETDAVNKPAAEIVLAQIQARFGQTDAPSRPYRIFCKFPPALLSRT